MEHIGIDLGGRESQICIRSPDGEIVLEIRCRTADLGEFLARRGKSRVILETCAEAFAVADQALALGHEVRVVPAMLVRSLGIGSRGVKNDRKDARVLSEVSCRIDLPSVHIPDPTSREAKSLSGTRECLIGARTKIVNNVRGWMRTELVQVRSGGTETFPKRVRKVLLEREAGMPSFIESALSGIEALTMQIVKLDEDLSRIAQANEICRRLMTAPIGPVTAVRYVAALDRIDRFASAHAVESYLGLTPREDFSCKRGQRGSITKAGSAAVRRALVQCCWSMWRLRPNDPLVLWAKAIAERRGKRTAIIAMARKLAGILYAMWRDATPYNPFHQKKQLEIPPVAPTTAAP